jgi:hypothetical protein
MLTKASIKLLKDERLPIANKLTLLKKDLNFAINNSMAIKSLESGLKQNLPIDDDFNELLKTYFNSHKQKHANLFDEKALPKHARYVRIEDLEHYTDDISLIEKSFYNTISANVIFTDAHMVFDNIDVLGSTLEDEDGKMFGSFVAPYQLLLVLPINEEKLERAIKKTVERNPSKLETLAKRFSNPGADISSIEDKESFISVCFDKYVNALVIKHRDYVRYNFVWLMRKEVYSKITKNGIFDCKADIY